MELGLFERIIEQVAPLTEQVCFHLMGEPLVHPQLEAMVEACHSRGVRIFLVTNGILMREKTALLLLHPAFRQVNFSLHSFNDNYPGRDPSKYLERIFEYTNWALDQRPDLYINYRLWNLKAPQGGGEHNASLLRRIEERFDRELDLSKLSHRYKSLHVKGRLYLHFDTEFVWPSMDLPVLGESGTCYGLKSHFGILMDGTVVPCCLDKEGKIPLGNANLESIEGILSSFKAQTILEGFRQKRLVEGLCQRCQYIQRFKPKKPQSLTL